METLDKYIALFRELILLRELEGGALPLEEESNYAALLSDLWWKLTPEEQEKAEALIAEPVSAPESLGLVDREVALGESFVPRIPSNH